MLEKLGFRHYVFRSEDKQDTATYDAEVDALKRHGIELLAWRMDSDANDPHTTLILETAAHHHVHPELWVTGAPQPTLKLPKDLEKLSAEEWHQVMPQI